MRAQPRFEPRPLLPHDLPGAGEDLLAAFRLHHRRSQAVREHAGGQGGVVVAHPYLLYEGGRGDGPAHPQAGQAEGLGKAARHHDPLVTAEEGRGETSFELGAAIDLVGDQVGAHPARGPHHFLHLLVVQHRPRRVVGIADQHEARLLRDRPPQPVAVEGPAALVQAQGEGVHASPCSAAPGPRPACSSGSITATRSPRSSSDQSVRWFASEPPFTIVT